MVYHGGRARLNTMHVSLVPISVSASRVPPACFAISINSRRNTIACVPLLACCLIERNTRLGTLLSTRQCLAQACRACYAICALSAHAKLWCMRQTSGARRAVPCPVLTLFTSTCVYVAGRSTGTRARESGRDRWPHTETRPDTAACLRLTQFPLPPPLLLLSRPCHAGSPRKHGH